MAMKTNELAAELRQLFNILWRVTSTPESIVIRHLWRGATEICIGEVDSGAVVQVSNPEVCGMTVSEIESPHGESQISIEIRGRKFSLYPARPISHEPDMEPYGEPYIQVFCHEIWAVELN